MAVSRVPSTVFASIICKALNFNLRAKYSDTYIKSFTNIFFFEDVLFTSLGKIIQVFKEIPRIQMTANCDNQLFIFLSFKIAFNLTDR